MRVALLILVLAVVSIVFFPSLKSGFVSWDDTVHLTQDLAVRGLDTAHLKKIFSQCILNVYIPLTSLSFALEYHFFQYDPFIYHLDNLLLHLAVTALIFYVGLNLGLSLRAAVLGSLLFGIHPMHVESVAWVTERKDVLYSFFYLLAVLGYWRYLQGNQKKYYVLSLLAGLLSILAKPMALSLPLILWLLDWFKKRPADQKSFTDKIPYFLVIIPIAWITYIRNARVPIENLGEGFLTWVWSFTFYIIKFCSPLDLSPIYQLPQPVNILNGHFILAVIVFVTFVFLVIRFRSNRWFIFSILWYFLSIFFLLRFDEMVDTNIVADRFMYLPSLGFCLAAGFGVDNILEQRKWNKFAYAVIGAVYLLLGAGSFQQSKIWNNNLNFWTYVISKNENIPLAYLNRGEEYIRQAKYDLALADTLKALDLRPQYVKAFNNLGNVYHYTGQYDLALKNYQLALTLNPDFQIALSNRGTLLIDMERYSEAINDFNRALQIDPEDFTVYTNRAKALKNLGKMEEALADCQKALMINPDYSAAYHNRGSIYAGLNDLEKALADFNRAIGLDPAAYQSYSNRCIIYFRKNDFSSALRDCNEAVRINPGYGITYLNRSLVLKFLNKREEARKDILKAGELGLNQLSQQFLDHF